MLGIVLGVYIGVILLLNIPFVQQKSAVFVAKELSHIMGTELTIGRIDMGLLNRIIIDDVLLDDQSGKEMLKVARLSAKFEILPLFKGKITISSVQLFGFNINLNKKTPDSPPNFKFVLDAFASQDTIKKEKNIDLRINSILIRRGKLAYDVFSEKETPGKFNSKHVRLQNIIANISLKALQNDSINASIKRLSVDEQSGFELKKLSLKLVANAQKMSIDNFSIDLPGTSLKMDTIHLDYDSLGAFKQFTDNVRFTFRTLPSYVTLKDISPFVPALSNFKEKIELDLDVNGTINQLNCSKLAINAGNQFQVEGDVSLQDLSHPQDAFIFGNLSKLSANSNGIGFLVRNLNKEYNGVPPILERLGDLSFRGEISGYFTDLVTYGLFHTNIGTVKTDLKLSSDKEKGLFAYSGAIKTIDFKLGKLLNNNKLGEVTFNLDVKGAHYDRQRPSIILKGLIAAIEYSNYKYENITLDGEYKHGGFNGKAALNDENGSVAVNGSINLVEKIPTFDFQASIKNLRPHELPSLILPPKKQIETDNNFSFDIHIFNVDILSSIFDIPLKIYTHSTIKGYVNDRMRRIRVEGYFPRLQYKNNFLESGLLLCENPSDQFMGKVRFTSQKKNGAVNISLEAQAKDDQVNTTINWGNNAAVTYSGQLAAMAQFLRTEGEKPLLKALVDIKPTDVILNDTIWQVHPSQVVVDSGKIDINDFYFSHADRYIRVDGHISDNPEDTVKVNLKDINIGYVFDIARISDDVNFEGDATGMAYASGVLKKPVLDTRLSIMNFTLNGGLLGDLDIYGAWDNEKKGIYLDAHIQEKDISKTHVNGFIYPIKPTSGLDLNIDANNLNIKFLEHYMRSIAQDVRGRASGKVHFYGKFKGLTLDGAVMTDASMKFDILNTSFALKDTIRLAPEGITFDNIHIADMEGHQGKLNGYLHYKHFKNIKYQFDIQVNNMLVMNTQESPDFPFYGTVYATGNALLAGNAQDGLDANIAMTTNRNTNFTYSTGTVASATNNQFIKFVDKTPRRSIQDSVQLVSFYEQVQQKIEKKESQTDIRLNILVDATPDATMKIIMDPVAGDYISGRGSGNIRMEFYNKGDMKMFGNYHIQQGIYKFSLQEVIRKDFIIKEGSTITFNGPPLDATLDIQASYTVPSASLNDLIPDASTIIQQPNVRVNCMMNLNGILLRPTIKLGIELPNERDEVQALVRNYLSTDEQMNMQILYLLGIGKFYMENNTGERQSSDMMSSVLSSTLSGQLNNMLSQIIDNNNWNIGTNLSTGEKGWTDMEVEGILSGQLLNNRLIINGNFGYRDNPMANTNFVGDFEAEWLLTRSGDVRLKAYNETNDHYYTKTNLTTQGVGVMYKKDFNKWNELFFWNKWKLRNRKKRMERKREEVQKSDSIGTDNDALSKIKRLREEQ